MCKRLIKGGVYKMKHHIAGVVGQVEACPKESDEDKKRVRDYLENSKNKKHQRVEELKEERAQLGTSFLGSIEESMEAHTGVYIFEFVEKYIIEIGTQHVVQVVTDNATNNMAAADLLKVTQPQIFWTSCATHTINPMLEAIGKLLKFSGILEKAKALTIFIYAHHRTLVITKKYTKKSDIVRPGVTRFATSFFTLESLKDKKDQLRLMFTSDEWSKTKLRSSVKGKAAEATPSMAFLLGALKQAKEDIKKSFKKEENAIPILKIIDENIEKSKGRLDSPLHYAAYLLNPFFYFKDSSISNDTNVMNEFLNCVEIIFATDEDMQSTIANDELLKYKSKSRNFGKKMASWNMSRMVVQLWW
ncbi:uncharacterized protein [Primulina huaijiensis]|uniref:uncharacterized protein n=1 Tax=Primulina huaijiensis TaxID=1492673 RepID=UPI003CC76B8E